MTAAAKPRTAADGLSRWKSEAERRAVNQILDRNGTWREVAAACEKFGRKGVTSANVTNYRKSKDRADWVAHQTRLEAIRRESELTAELSHMTAAVSTAIEAALAPSITNDSDQGEKKSSAESVGGCISSQPSAPITSGASNPS